MQPHEFQGVGGCPRSLLLPGQALCRSIHKSLLLCRHTSRFLLWWLTGFPFAAWSSYGWVTPLVTAVVTVLLLGVENIGIQIEEPFEVLPIESITAACIASVHEILERHHGELPTAQ